MLSPLLTNLVAYLAPCCFANGKGLRAAAFLSRVLTLLAVSPVLILGPCYGEVMMLLPTGIGASISDSLLPDHGERREVEGQMEEEKIHWAPVVSQWAWSELDPAWKPLGEAAAPESFLAFWEASPSVFPSQVVSPLMPIPLATEPAEEGGPLAEVTVGLEPPAEDQEAWLPAEAEGAPAAEAEAAAGGPQNPLLVEQELGECTVMGEVSDKTTLEPIEGAIVTIGGTGREDETDAEGRFRVDGLPQGVYTVEVLKLGYSMGSASASPRPGTPAEIRIALTLKPTDDGDGEFMLAEETVLGEYQDSGSTGLSLDLQAAPQIAAGLSKDDFSRSNVGDAGDAVSKISGANIVGGRYAVVRGLGDRYSGTLVNGALISSADPSRKAIQLDLFPSDLLESVSIYKTFRPELPAEFAGGTVAIETLKFPEETLIQFEYGMDFNSELDGPFFGSGTDLGQFGRVESGLPPEVLDGFIGGSGSRRPNQFLVQQGIIDSSALHLSSPFRPTPRSGEDPQSYSLALGDTFELGDSGLELGVVVAATAGNGDTADRGIEVSRGLDFGPDRQPGTPDDGIQRTQTEDRFTSTAGYGLLASVGIRAGERHQIGFTGFQNYEANDEVILVRRLRDAGADGAFPDFVGPGRDANGQAFPFAPFGATAAAFQGADSIVPLRRTLTLLQGDGHHEVGDVDRPIKIDWLISKSNALEERPQTSTVFFSEYDYSDPAIQNVNGGVYRPELGTVLTLADPSGANPPLNNSFRETLSTDEEATNSKLDLELPLWSDGEDRFFNLKIGGNNLDKAREVRGQLFEYTISGAFNDRLISDDGGLFGVGTLSGFNGVNDPNGDLIFDGRTDTRFSNAIFIDESTTVGNTARNVDAGTELSAGFLQASLKLGDWDLVGGARYETEARSFEILAGLNPPGVVTPRTTIKNDYVLPAFFMSRDFGRDDAQKVSLAWARTVARPTFFEFAPVRTVDQTSGDVFQGNANLKDTLIDNFDLRWEWHPDLQTDLAVSLFHKNMQAPIAQTFLLGDRTFVNGDRGTLQGLEIEFRKEFLEYWSLTSNYTYIDSQLTFSQETGGGTQTINTTFEGQPNHIFNLIFGWADDELGLSATLNYNFTGSYLTIVPSSPVDPPIRREGFHQLDFVLRKSFETPYGVGIVKFNIANLLDSEDRELFDGTDQVFNSSRPGRTYEIGLEYQF